MKIVLTGGGTGGHFYPLIAVSEALTDIIDDKNIADTEIYYISDTPYDARALYENGITYRQVPAGKIRSSFSLKSISDAIKTFAGLISGFFTVMAIMPDAVFSKGGYAAFPTVFAARVLGIPVIVHESDSVPGRVNVWSGKFARAIAVSYKQEIDYFPKEKLIHTGQPIRRDLMNATKEGAYEFLGLDKDIPVLWIVGGSLGAKTLNLAIEAALPELLKKYQIIHQVGKDNYDSMKKLTDATLVDNPYKNRYKIFDSLNALSMKMAAGITDVVVTRAGSALFEIAHWEIPAIVIPLPSSHKNHQLKNAYNYAREGACIVIEENNLSSKLLAFEINRINDSEPIKKEMREGARRFALEGAAQHIAEEIIGIGLAHDK